MSEALPQTTDVIVVGAGNAAFCAALAAAEHGVSVLVLERAPEEEGGRQQPLHGRRVPLRLRRRG
jgi:tricarballylate dehydrogenase